MKLGLFDIMRKLYGNLFRRVIGTGNIYPDLTLTLGSILIVLCVLSRKQIIIRAATKVIHIILTLD